MRFFMTNSSIMDDLSSVTKDEMSVLEQYVEDSLPKLLDFAIDVI